MSDVEIIMGSKSDMQIVEGVKQVLEEFGVSYNLSVASAHREPDKVSQIVKGSQAKIFIAIAGLSAALPGVIASQTKKPVIGVPVSGKLMGMDALLSIAQMPSGVPVACVGVDNGKNAAHLAVRILALSDSELAKKLEN